MPIYLPSQEFLKMSHTPTRRSFLQQTAVLGAVGMGGSLLKPHLVRADSPNGTLNVAYIGVFGIGRTHILNTHRLGVNCLTYCDVDPAQMGDAKQRWENAVAYTDYREMFDKQHRNIDAVMIGTPDHQHYTPTMIAMQLGKHVYVQKPLTHTVWEARQLLLASRKYKVVTQMGNQGHANEGNRVIVEYIRSGLLGTIKEIHAWSNRPTWPQGMANRPDGEDPIPDGLNWDAWIGPAPMRPYKRGVYHRSMWRGWWDFGGGALADMACHTIDGIYWAMEPGHPLAVEPFTTTPVSEESFPKSSVVKYEFAAKGQQPAWNLYWYDGGLKPQMPVDFEMGRNLPVSGNLIVGSKATLLVSGDYGDRSQIIPDARHREIGRPPQMLERSPGHYEEWVMACRGEKSIDFPGSNFEYSAPLSEVVLLGNVAIRAGRRIEWDGDKLEVTNLPQANKWITKEYREGWGFEQISLNQS